MTARLVLILCAALAVTGCREEKTAALPQPVALTPLSVGYFCQMNLLEHSGPKAQIFLKDVMDPLFFSQVRDAIAYQRMPEQSHEIVAIYVNDMGAASASWAEPGKMNWALADDAVYVTGSRVMGGMGLPELVPFTDRTKAQDFAAKNGGKVVTLADIPDADVLTPEGAGPETGGASEDTDYLARLKSLGLDNGEKP